ncbi:transcription termination factor MTERF8, chloroplastic [Mercurialis annua]|uniref:transcription termination factor MTERF8, chloroplastic n=1 Tax=Mercurialis annua TaxID=3986 RepID=UPI00215E727D|nr:transcription termination factor MTERF8, chloroplastic [Mercurialis annua]
MSSIYHTSTPVISQTLVSYPTKLQLSITSLPLISDHHHHRSTISNSANYRTSKSDLRSFLFPTDSRLVGNFSVQCSCVDSLPNHPYITSFLYSFFGECGLNEKETEYLLEHNPSLGAASFDSIQARVSLIESAGIKGVELSRLIIKCPYLLTAEEVHIFLHFVLNSLHGNVEPAQLKRLFAATEPRFLVGFGQKVSLLISHGVPKEKIVHILNNVNLTKAMCLKSIQEIDRTISFLSRFGGIDIIVRRPMILNFDLDTQLIPRIEFLKEISGGDEEATGILLRKLPALLSYSVEHTKDHVECLRSFAGLTDSQIFKIFLVFPNVVSASRERKLRPRIQFLKQCDLSSDEIFKFLTRAPLFLALSFRENIAHKLVVLAKIGYGYKNKELAVALGAVTRTSCENLQKVVELFLSYGFSPDDIFAMSKKHPQILQYSYRSLQEKMEYLVEGMGREVDELLAFPAFLGYKLDDRIKHRFEVNRNVIGEKMSINKLLSVSADRFSAQKKKKSYS